MRRVAAASVESGAAAFRAEDRVGLRLAGRSFELPIGCEVLAGRAAQCDLRIDDRLCSRQHAVFSRAPDGGALVRDLGSTNGTYVNGVRIYTDHRLARGDWTTIGNETLELCLLPAAAREVSPTIPVGPSRRATPASSARSTSKTDPGSPLLSLAGLATAAAHRTAAAARAGAARKPLDVLLRRSERGERIAAGDAEMAGMVALNLCKSSSDPAWLDYVFRLYTALSLPLPASLIERLQETLTSVHLVETTALSTYIETLQRAPGEAPSETRQQLIASLTELQHAHRERR